MVYSTGADEALQANKAGTEPQVERLARYLDLSKPDRTAVLDWVLVLLTCSRHGKLWISGRLTGGVAWLLR